MKDGRYCVDCLPCRKGNCYNSTLAVSVESGPTSSHTLSDQAPQNELGSTSLLTSPPLLVTSSPYLLSDSSFYSVDPEPEKTNDVDENHVADFCLPSCPRGICDLPHFEELADPQFVWGTLDGAT